MNRQPLIRLSHLTGGYEGKTVLRDVSLEIYPDDFIGVIGPNGGGKTTLVKMMLGLLKPMSGEIMFFRQGERTDGISIGYLPQYSTIDRKFPISVYETVLSGLNRQKPLFRPFTPEQHEQVRRTIVRMGLEGLERRAIGQLSGGQMQRALLGRALVSDPQVLILDEPDTYIDRLFAQRLYALLEEINRERAIILVSHNISTVMRHAKSIACVDRTLHYCPDTHIPPEWLEEHLTAI